MPLQNKSKPAARIDPIKIAAIFNVFIPLIIPIHPCLSKDFRIYSRANALRNIPITSLVTLDAPMRMLAGAKWYKPGSFAPFLIRRIPAFQLTAKELRAEDQQVGGTPTFLNRCEFLFPAGPTSRQLSSRSRGRPVNGVVSPTNSVPPSERVCFPFPMLKVTSPSPELKK
jgi:hypothetical protein